MKFVRIVKLTLKHEDTENFKALFSRNRIRIRSREGCSYLEVFQDKNSPNIFFTYSIWEDEKYLEAYRNSELFKEVWGTAKTFFADKPEAWSVVSVDRLD